MSLKKVLGKALVYGVLEIGALCGVPMRPEQIAELMQITERAAVQVVRKETGDGKDDDKLAPDGKRLLP